MNQASGHKLAVRNQPADFGALPSIKNSGSKTAELSKWHPGAPRVMVARRSRGHGRFVAALQDSDSTVVPSGSAAPRMPQAECQRQEAHDRCDEQDGINQLVLSMERSQRVHQAGDVSSLREHDAAKP